MGIPAFDDIRPIGRNLKLEYCAVLCFGEVVDSN